MSRGGRCDKRVTDATQDAVNEGIRQHQYLQDHLSDLISWVKVLIAIAVFMIRACSDPIYTENREKIAGKVSADKSGAVRRLCFEIFFIFSVDFFYDS